ncbi:MAG TPA: hypothetical protein VD886_18650 [Herpetosiphonaceae bacterium]|nr:hypothetical protein [Herpetosiphonaceae bacterium]
MTAFEIVLMLLKLIMFSILIVGPVMIGRHIVQAAKGNQLQPAAADQGVPAEAEDAA